FTGLTVSILIGFLLFFWQQTGAPDWQILAGGVLLLLPAVIATLIIWNAKGKSDFSRASLLVKIVMFAGLFLLLRSWPEDLSSLVETEWAAF
ncbi:MAG: hypothetical protein IT262_17150, partial [Saprospiraceae bacterium]|nr:hypothetical protein [Saprospiraceae bacterium]